MSSIEERIKRQAKTATEVQKLHIKNYWDNFQGKKDAVKKWDEEVVKKKWVRVKEVLQILKELWNEFPCKPCMDIDTSLSPCQLDLVKWYTKWKMTKTKPCLKGRKRHYFGRKGSGRSRYSQADMSTAPRNRCVWCGYNKVTGEYEEKRRK